MSRRKQPTFSPQGRLAVHCRRSDSMLFCRDEFEAARPIHTGPIAFFATTWPSEWFDPSVHLLRFPYIGTFESSSARLWFACDGNDVAAFVAWLPTLDEMKRTPPKTATGEVDSARLELFGKFLVVRERANVIIQAAG